MLRSLMICAVAAMLAIVFAPVVWADDAKMDSADLKFIRAATEGGQMEVALGKLASEKGVSEDVKKFGQHMVDEHSKANEQLARLCTDKGVDLSADKEKMDKAIQKQVDKLSKLQGEEFDKEYVSEMVKDHEKDLKAFQKAAEDAKDSDLRAWAAKTVPMVQSHLDMIKEIQTKLGK